MDAPVLPVRHERHNGAIAVARAAAVDLWAAFPWKGLIGIRDPIEHIVRPMIEPQVLFRCYEGTVHEWAGRFFMEHRPNCLQEMWGFMADVVGDTIVAGDRVVAIRASPDQVRSMTPSGYTNDWADSHMNNRDILMHKRPVN